MVEIFRERPSPVEQLTVRRVLLEQADNLVDLGFTVTPRTIDDIMAYQTPPDKPVVFNQPMLVPGAPLRDLVEVSGVKIDPDIKPGDILNDKTVSPASIIWTHNPDRFSQKNGSGATPSALTLAKQFTEDESGLDIREALSFFIQSALTGPSPFYTRAYSLTGSRLKKPSQILYLNCMRHDRAVIEIDSPTIAHPSISTLTKYNPRKNGNQ